MTEPFVHPDVRALLDYIAQAGGARLRDVGPEGARKMVRAMRDMADADPVALATVRDLAIPGPHGTIPARLYDPRASREAGPVLVYFHGGGFVMGDLDTYEPLCTAIAAGLDLPVVSIDYRLAPEHPWPAAPDDCEAAARWIAGSPPELDRAVTGVVLAGDSAGGALTVVTALALRDAPATVPVLAQWPIYPAVDLGGRYPSQEELADAYMLTRDGLRWFNECYQPDYLHWRASPLRADQAGLPPTLILTTSLDPLRDQGRAYAAACVSAGVQTVYREAIGTIHGFMTMRKALPSAERDLRGCLAALKAMIAEAVAA